MRAAVRSRGDVPGGELLAAPVTAGARYGGEPVFFQKWWCGRNSLRVVQTLAPSPIPPVVISRSVRLAARAALRSCLLRMHLDPAGEQILSVAAISHCVPVVDADYDPIRAMNQLADRLSAW